MALLYRTLLQPERVFSVYYDRLNKPAVKQWAFARSSRLAIAGEYDSGMAAVTFYVIRVGGRVVDLNRYVAEDDHGEQLVEIQLY